MRTARLLRHAGNSSSCLVASVILLLLSHGATAQRSIRLYDGPAPGSETWNWPEGETTNNPTKTKIIYNVTTPTLTVFQPDAGTANGSAVIIVPGGGGRVLLFEKEGVNTAKALAKKGITAFVLKYRLQQSKTDDPWKEMMAAMNDPAAKAKAPAPLATFARQDLMTAVRHVRRHAAAYGVDSTRVGVAGFSAGSVISLNIIYNADLDAVPDFAAINYGVMRTVQKAPFREKVTPLFIAVAADDMLAPASNSIELFNEWYGAKRPVELHVYASGGHGLNAAPASAWIDRFVDWLQAQGFLAR